MRKYSMQFSDTQRALLHPWHDGWVQSISKELTGFNCNVIIGRFFFSECSLWTFDGLSKFCRTTADHERSIYLYIAYHCYRAEITRSHLFQNLILSKTNTRIQEPMGPEGPGFDSRWGHWLCSLLHIISAHILGGVGKRVFLCGVACSPLSHRVGTK